MSEIIVVVLLIVPVVLAVIVLNYLNKKQKRKAHNKLSAYASEITNQLQIKQSFWKRLPYQLIIIDDESREILVVDYNDNNHLSHELLSLDMIESLKVVRLKQAVSLGERNKKTEAIITQIGLEVCFTKPRKEIFLVVYDHVAHNNLQMAELEKEARQLHDDINKFRVPQMISASSAKAMTI